MNINATRVTTTTPITFRNNPKRVGKKAWSRYEIYQMATTIGEYLEIAESKYAKADLRYDLDKEFLILTDYDAAHDEALVIHIDAAHDEALMMEWTAAEDILTEEFNQSS